MEALRVAAYKSFDDRRSYEWKLSLAIWTPLAVLVAGLVQPGHDGIFPFHGTRYGIAATGVGVVIVLLHIFFNNGMARANAIDKDVSVFYAKKMRTVIGLRFDSKLDQQLDALPARPKHPQMQWLQWGHLTQIGFTFLLTLLAVVIVWLRVTA